MKDLIKSKSHMCAKLFIYQFASSLLGIFVVSPFEANMHIYCAIFSTLFYFSLVCYAVIEDGQKDCISLRAGRIPKKSYTGLLYSLVSYVPTIVVVVFMALLNLLTSQGSFAGLKSILTVVIRFFLMGMYLGFDTGLVVREYDTVSQSSVVTRGAGALEFMSDNYLIFAICLIFLPLVAGICYDLALKGKVHVNTATKKKSK